MKAKAKNGAGLQEKSELETGIPLGPSHSSPWLFYSSAVFTALHFKI